MKGLPQGAAFAYRVRKGGEFVFAAEGVRRRRRASPIASRSSATAGRDGPEQKAVAYQAYRARPDFVLIAGDIVYTRGRISEYREKFWPVYDADVASPLVGGAAASFDPRSSPRRATTTSRPATWRSTPTAWPISSTGTSRSTARSAGGRPARAPAHGARPNQEAFAAAAGAAYPRMANFSFDYGNAHWTVLDSNPYVDWTDAELRGVGRARPGRRRQDATWRFVAFHHPRFNSSQAHFGDQRMRLLADVFEAGRG